MLLYIAVHYTIIDDWFMIVHVVMGYGVVQYAVRITCVHVYRAQILASCLSGISALAGRKSGMKLRPVQRQTVLPEVAVDGAPDLIYRFVSVHAML